MEPNLDNYVSLFTYLGKKAGPDLGKKVYAASVEQRQPSITEPIKSKTYTGTVRLYKRDFLDSYFKSTQGFTP